LPGSSVGPARAARTTLALREIWGLFDEDSLFAGKRESLLNL